jgi:CRISPR/Cas system-associated exonuclease Cas4 (RecB family)
VSKTVLLHPSISLIEEVSLHLIYDSGDYSSNIVIFPGRRPAHFLRKYLARKRKSSFIPPRVYSMDDFIDWFYEKILGLNYKKAAVLDAVEVLYRLNNSAKIAPFKGSETPESFIGLGIRLFRDFEELYIEQIPSTRVKEVDLYVDYNISRKTTDRITGISELYSAFYSKLKDLGLSTRAVRYSTVAENLSSHLDRLFSENNIKRIIFGGFFALTEAEKKLFSTLKETEQAIFIFQDAKGMKEMLKRLSFQYEEKKGTGKASSDVQIISTPDTHGQVFALNRMIKEMRDRKEINETVAVVLPTSETLMPVLHYCLGEMDEREYNISMGYPLSRTPLFGFFNCLLDVLNYMYQGMVYIPEYLRFVLHPYTKNIYFSEATGRTAETTRIIFHAIEDTFVNRWTKTFVRLDEIEALPFKIESLKDRANEFSAHIRDIHHHTLGRFSSIANVGDFVKSLSEVLIYIYENSTASRHPYFQPFAEAFLRVFDEIRESRFSKLSLSHIEGYTGFFRRYISLQTVPFEGTPLRGLQVLGFLETRNLSFRKVFILDCNEGILPEAKSYDSLIPNRARELLGLPTHHDRERLSAYYFDLLLKSSDEVALFYVSDDKRERSRFIESLLWERQKERANLYVDDIIRSVQYQVLLRNPKPLPVEKTPEVVSTLSEFKFTPTSLDEYLRCPIRFYYKHLLNLRETVKTSAEPDKTEVGNLIHRILKEYFIKTVGRELEEKTLSAEEMRTLVERFFTKEYGAELIGRQYLIKRQVQRRLEELIKEYYIPLAKTRKVKTLYVEMPLTARYGPFTLTGVIDRVELRNERVFVIDYKTASQESTFRVNFKRLDPKNKQSWNCIGSLQIPFYMLLYSLARNHPTTELSGVYLLLGRAKVDGKIEYNIFKEIDREFPMIEEVIQRILQEIMDPAEAFYPTQDFRQNCPNCVYREICGTSWVRAPAY